MSTVETITRIERVAVVGAGNMGSGIAQKVATEGYPVVLIDVSADMINRGMERLHRTLDEGVTRRIFTKEKSAEILGRISPATALEEARDVDLVIEAVYEDLPVKREVFSRLDRACKPDAILATNTSSFYVHDLVPSSRRAERFLGLHYFYHPAKNRLVEVVAGKETAPEIVDLAWRFQEAIGKTPIRSADSPGFIVNRFFVPWINEAVRLLDEGVADIATIEAAAKAGFGVGMGPFELMNVTGIAIGLHAASTLGRELGSFYAPAAPLLGQVERAEPWPVTAAEHGTPVATFEGATPALGAKIIDRLLAVTFLVAGELIDEGVCSIEDCDIGARVGLRWPAGPFELMNREGIERTVELTAGLAQRWELPIPRVLTERRRQGGPFRFRHVRLEVRDGIGTITINRPDALNALNEEVIEQLGACVSEAIADSQVRAIVLTGAGKAFVAGADIKFFIDKIEAGDLASIRRFTERGQEVFNQIDRSPKTVVCQLGGLALGGGAELALTCDHIVASTRSALGFPETGIGIYPGLGGTQRTRERVGVPLTKVLIYTGEVVSAQAAFESGLIDAVVEPSDLERVAREWALNKPPAPVRRPAAVPERFRSQADLLARTPVTAVLSGEVKGDGDEGRERLLKRIRAKAPLALRYAEEIIDRGAALPLAEGLALELSHLEDVFRSADALAGMKSVVEGGKPEFKGR